ncbi:class I SAM-dependent methyltransferase [Pseudomonas fulva]|uniref:class I SAM-dependent methyltransferase n=1 Tax=Pseudomonas TaxID=286 RepID=UPI0011247D22|nr:class I SAM-dependent methyltransferase [Pseudomonas sp. SWI7]QDC04536.1 class I SAM-dependent methyltransferase [Pseudomonas sp. SWI7]
MSHHPSADHIIDLYDRHAFTWHQKRANHFTDRKWIPHFGNMLKPSARVLDLGLGCQFDAIIAWNSFFHLKPTDQRLMFPIFRRHAAPGALLMFTSGPSHGEALGTFEGETLYHASLSTNEYVDQLHANGFEVLDHVVEDPDSGGLTVWLGRLLP